MKQQSSDNELLQFADIYLREAFPNPTRTGCPADQKLQKLAAGPRYADLYLTEHISCCSPCYVRYSTLLQEQKVQLQAGPSARVRRYWPATPTGAIWAAFAVLLLICVGVLIIVSKRSSDSYSAFTINLKDASPVRGAERETKKHEIQVPRRLTDLTIQLPLGSKEGVYQISLLSGQRLLWSQSAQAHFADHITVLETQLDLRVFSTGQYIISVESAGRVRFLQPIQITRSR